MRSLFARILLWSILVAILSGAAFVIITRATLGDPPPFAGPYRRFGLHFMEARRIYESEGKAALAAYLARLRRAARVECVLTDGNGIDLVSGEYRGDLLPHAQGPAFRRGFKAGPPDGPPPRILGRRSEDGAYYFFQMPAGWAILPPLLSWHHLAVLGILALLSYVLARHLVAPVREIEQVLERFGSGDLSARVNSRRSDELGRLAQTFNQMAGRIETLLAAERRLLMDISHEIRSPLTRLNLAVELARSVEDKQAALDRIQREADRLNELVGGLLQVTRAEGDPDTLRRQPVDLAALVRDAVADSELDLQARNCQVAVDAPDKIEIEGDHELLRRAFENVLRNAIRYSPPSGVVDVRVTNQNGDVSIQVRDRGPGVPAHLLDRLFEPFFRVEESEGARSGGFGLGLSIARRAVLLHNGSITAENAGPGLLVRIRLPRSGRAAGHS